MATALLSIERRCHPHLGDDALPLPGGEVAEVIDDGVDALAVQMANRVFEHLPGRRGRAIGEQVGHDRRLCRRRLCRAGERHLKLRRFVERPAEAEELVIGRVEGAIGLGHREDRLIGELLDRKHEVGVVRPAIAHDVDEDSDREIGHLAGENLPNEALADRMQLPGVSQRHAQLVLMLEQPRDGEEFAGKRVEPGALTTGVKCLGLTRKRLTAGSEHQRAACCSRSVRKSSTVARMRASSLSAWPMTLPASPTAISPTWRVRAAVACARSAAI